MDLHIFRTETGAQVFTDSVVSDPRMPARFRPFAVVPLYIGLAYSEPIGNVPSNSFKPLLDREISWSRVIFSPDAHFVIAGSPPFQSIVVDLHSMKKIKIGGTANAAFKHEAIFVSGDRLAALGRERADESALLSFPDGEEIKRLGLEGSATATTRPECVVQWKSEAGEGTVVDLNTLRVLAKVSRLGGDVFGDSAITLTEDGDLLLTRMGLEGQTAKVHMVTMLLPILRAAAATPNLESIVLAVRGQAAAFRVHTGERIARFDHAGGAWCETDHDCLLRTGPKTYLGTKVEAMEAETGTTSLAWSREFSKDKPEQDYFSGPVLLSRTSTPGIMMRAQPGPAPFVFGALEASTGKQLWTRKFEGEAPIPFTNPQGDRVVLGWDAKSSGAHDAAKRDPNSWRLFKAAKLSKRDTYFEILDARTGREIAGALVQSGAGPESFGSAFSAGDWLVLIKDGTRVSVVSLSSGEEKLHLFGTYPALSPRGEKMALEIKIGVVAVYDLASQTMVRELRLPQHVVYLNFSGDEKRLLALTENQAVYVFDVSKQEATPTIPQ